MHDLLRTLPPARKRKWPEHLPELLYVYNATPHSSTMYSPHFLMFGREARLPIDLLLGEDEEVDENPSDWLATHQARLRDAYQRAGEHLKQQAEKRQDQYFEREYNIPIQKGQLVHLRNHVRGRNKIQDAWDSTLYKVVDVPRDILVSVYTVEPVDSPGETKKVHRSNLRISTVRPTKEQKDHRTQSTKPSSTDSSIAADEEDNSDEKFVLILPKEYTSPTAATVTPGETEPTVSVRNDHACPEEEIPTVQHDSDPVPSAESGANVQSNAEPVPTAEDPDSETLPTPPRRTKRKTAGKHKNKLKQPRTAVTSPITITVNELSVYLLITTLLVIYGLYI